MESIVAEPSILEIVAQIIATVLLVLFIKKYTQQNFIDYLQKRKDFVNNSLEETKENNEKAAELFEQAAIQEKDMREKRAKIMETSQVEAKREKEQIIQESKVQAKQIIEKANQEAEASRQGVIDEISEEVLDLVALVSEKFLSGNMGDEANMALIAQALEEVENENN